MELNHILSLKEQDRLIHYPHRGPAGRSRVIDIVTKSSHKPIANSFRNSFIRFFIELTNISMSFFIINIKSFAAMYNRTPVPLT
nr:MAG TPA: hypothetical protein [Caudoviricetes sp.]